ncbi:MAG: hypothetical protein OXC53_06460 [Rhodobacteraceae bacterium]|nr:hypothetical protein [Paracoccaceae bacterium]
MTIRIIGILAVILLWALPARAEEVSDQDRFELWNACLPIQMYVSVDEDSVGLGLTEDRIATTVRSRLRSARLYSEEPLNLLPHLHIGVDVAGQGFLIRFQFMKYVVDAFELSTALEIAEVTTSAQIILENASHASRGYAPTWNNGGFGTHSNDPNFILSFVAEQTDHFIDEYLRVNAAECGGACESVSECYVKIPGGVCCTMLNNGVM